MMQTKFIIDNADYDDWNEYGRWLNEQASDGLYFKRHILGITVFSQCQEKWKYTCVPANDHADTLAALATLKEDGWERVSRGGTRVYRVPAERPVSYIPTVECKPPTAKSLAISHVVLVIFYLAMLCLLYAASLYKPDNKTVAIVGGILLTAMMALITAVEVYDYRRRKQKKRGSRYVLFFFTMARLALTIAFIALWVAPLLLML